MTKIQRLLIFGTGGNCLDILEIVRNCNAESKTELIRPVGFLDDALERRGESFGGLPVLGAIAEASRMAHCSFVNGIGSSNSFRRKSAIVASAGVPDDRFLTVVHSSAIVASTASIGPGCVLFAHVSVWSRARIGAHSLILAGTVINHDVNIGSHASIAAGAILSGGVSIGSSCYLGAGCVIREGVSIGDGSLIGMGSVVIEDVPDDSVVAGNPARILRRFDN